MEKDCPCIILWFGKRWLIRRWKSANMHDICLGKHIFTYCIELYTSLQENQKCLRGPLMCVLICFSLSMPIHFQWALNVHCWPKKVPLYFFPFALQSNICWEASVFNFPMYVHWGATENVLQCSSMCIDSMLVQYGTHTKVKRP